MMRECTKRECKHHPFQGKTVFCKGCPEVVPQPTGEICVRCGTEIRKYNSKRGWSGCINYCCLKCTKEAKKVDFGMATDANLRFCYWLETGLSIPLDVAENMLDKQRYAEFTEIERGYYDAALKAYNRMKAHSMMGGVWCRY